MLTAIDATETNNVDESSACPCCGERDADLLVWDEDFETVTCDKCGAQYEPWEV